MCLIHRSTFWQLLSSDIHKYTQKCILQAAGTLPTPEILHELHLSTKEWIKEKTAYAIFSHRWLGKGELTFQDISKFAKLTNSGFRKLIGSRNRKISGGANILDQVINLALKTKKTTYNHLPLLDIMKELCQTFSDTEREDCQGFVKLIEFFRISSEYGCRYVWFDTGCIDKSSSAELEESIRSMFNWYQNSKICIIHLADTTDVRSLRKDPWFTRGWTLQELLAPRRVKLYGKSWQPIISTSSGPDNDKDCISNKKGHLWKHILDITQISSDHIFNFTPGIHQARDALVWLSKRRTTRIEDMAYCLIGLLNIPLSIAYGEGKNAFYRLQLEILQRTPDMGLFSWLGQPAIDNSMLAAGPDSFQSSLALQPLFPQTPTDLNDRSYSLTYYGLRIPLSVYSVRMRNAPNALNRKGNTTLQVEGFGRITVNLQTSGVYEAGGFAVLGEITSQSSEEKKGLAILLGFKDGQWKRIMTTEHIILSLPIDNPWQEPKIRFIQ